jgi:hypothetical protein
MIPTSPQKPVNMNCTYKLQVKFVYTYCDHQTITCSTTDTKGAKVSIQENICHHKLLWPKIIV